MQIGISGLDLLRHMTENDPDVTIVMITAYGSIATAIDTMKNGAQDYLLKPFNPVETGIII
ncbi:MAG: response regulator [Thermodesulfobacteriota bacterium]|nr:response regulator [Thermodesulfobacteriota bacterium]